METIFSVKLHCEFEVLINFNIGPIPKDVCCCTNINFTKYRLFAC